MSTRLLLYILCALAGALSTPLMFGLLPPNHKLGIRIEATLADPTIWYVAHGILGWAVFSGAVALIVWLKRHPNAARPSPFTLVALAMAALFGFMSG